VNVVALSVTPVKGTRLHRAPQIELDHAGARGNRRFFVVDGRDRMVNAKPVGALQTIVADCPSDDVLRLTFPDGGVVESTVAVGDPLQVRFFSHTTTARPVKGPFSRALTEYLGREIRLMQSEAGAVDRGASGGVSLISSASLSRLAEVAEVDGVDARRFRMLVEVDGLAAHEEDGWVGKRARIGNATVQFGGHVGRCLITSRDPETGEITLPTLDVLGEYRRDLRTTEPLPFGIYGQVVTPGTVRVGDAVGLVD
jgi:uncharacterized protein YcbX